MKAQHNKNISINFHYQGQTRDSPGLLGAPIIPHNVIDCQAIFLGYKL